MAQPEPRAHGGLPAAELRGLGRDPAQVLDFSVNVNPYGPLPAVEHAARTAALDRYPDPTAQPAREALAGVLDVPPDRLVVGHGAAELLWTLATALMMPGDRAVVLEPTFSEFRSAVEARGGEVVAHRVTEAEGFLPDLDAFAERLQASRAKLAYVCAPNNPTGRGVAVDALYAIARTCRDTVFVIDQAFLALSERHRDRGRRPPDNVVLVRSMTKEHALPGLRVGYLVAPLEIARRLERCRPPWSASAPVQCAVEAICRQGEDFVARSRRRLLADRVSLEASLEACGLCAWPSETSYSLVRVGDATQVRARLLARRGIAVRDCSSFGLPAHIRLAARPARDLERLRTALKEEMET